MFILKKAMKTGYIGFRQTRFIVFKHVPRAIFRTVSIGWTNSGQDFHDDSIYRESDRYTGVLPGVKNGIKAYTNYFYLIYYRWV